MEFTSLPDLSLAQFARGDIPAALRLVEESRWNQVAADWELFISQGTAFRASTAEGTLVATAAILPYPPRFGWISMVLVTQAWRRRGIASAMLGLCTRRLQQAGLVPVLDATPSGREVYRPLGFRDGWPITRWRRPAGEPPAVLAHAPLPARPLAESDWAHIAQLDAQAFGGERMGLLRQLAQRSLSFACVVEREGRIAGYLLGREGRIATQLGPIVAADDAVAHALLAHALAREHGPVLADALDQHVRFRGLLAQAGFAIERPYTRMALEFDGMFGDAGLKFAIAGPELG